MSELCEAQPQVRRDTEVSGDTFQGPFRGDARLPRRACDGSKGINASPRVAVLDDTVKILGDNVSVAHRNYYSSLPEPGRLTRVRQMHDRTPHHDCGRRIACLLTSCPDEWLKIWPVDKKVGNVRNKGAELVLPL
jgi:hypothetical protein